MATVQRLVNLDVEIAIDYLIVRFLPSTPQIFVSTSNLLKLYFLSLSCFYSIPFPLTPCRRCPTSNQELGEIALRRQLSALGLLLSLLLVRCHEVRRKEQYKAYLSHLCFCPLKPSKTVFHM